MEKVFRFVGTKLAQDRLQLRSLVILALLLACVLHVVLKRNKLKRTQKVMCGLAVISRRV